MSDYPEQLAEWLADTASFSIEDPLCFNDLAETFLASPVLAQMKREWQAEALRDAADAVRSSVSYGFGMRPDGTEDPQAAAYAEGVRDAWQIVRDRAEASGQEGT